MIDISKTGKSTGLVGVFTLGEFDKAAADAGEYQIGMSVKTPTGRETVLTPVRSVGANPKSPGRFYFSTDERFKNLPGFGCVWPSPPGVSMVSAVPVRLAPGEKEES